MLGMWLVRLPRLPNYFSRLFPYCLWPCLWNKIVSELLRMVIAYHPHFTLKPLSWWRRSKQKTPLDRPWSICLFGHDAMRSPQDEPPIFWSMRPFIYCLPMELFIWWKSKVTILVTFWKPFLSILLPVVGDDRANSSNSSKGGGVKSVHRGISTNNYHCWVESFKATPDSSWCAPTKKLCWKRKYWKNWCGRRTWSTCRDANWKTCQHEANENI